MNEEVKVKRFERFVYSIAFCAIVAAPPYLTLRWACRLLPWGYFFPGVGWTP